MSSRATSGVVQRQFTKTDPSRSYPSNYELVLYIQSKQCHLCQILKTVSLPIVAMSQVTIMQCHFTHYTFGYVTLSG